MWWYNEIHIIIYTSVSISVRAKPQIVQLNGLKIEVFKTKIKIHDLHNDVSTIEAEKIVEYLYREGFIEKQSIICEILRTEEE